MCHLITVILKPKKYEDVFKDILKCHKKHVSNANDGRYNSVLNNDEIYLYATGKMCDCGTELGSLSDPGYQRVSLEDINKFKKKGWSQTKINRYIAEVEKNNRKQKRIKQEQEGRSFTSENNPDGWIDIIRDVLSTDKYSMISIIKHWYSGPLKEDVLSKENREHLKYNVNLSEKLFKIKEDVCYTISNEL